MQATNTGQSWGWVARVLHWTMAALILFQLGLADGLLPAGGRGR
jgi:cytochrome b561